MGMFRTSISAVVYPMLSELSSYDDNDNFISTIVKSVNRVILLVVPISVGAIILAILVVNLLFER